MTSQRARSAGASSQSAASEDEKPGEVSGEAVVASSASQEELAGSGRGAVRAYAGSRRGAGRAFSSLRASSSSGAARDPEAEAIRAAMLELRRL